MSIDPENTTSEDVIEQMKMTEPESDIESSDFSSEMSESDGDEGDEAPVAVVTKTKKPNTKAKGVTKAPRKKAIKKEKTVKAKKPRTIRRPYKSMDYDKLVTKQAIASGRFEVVSKRMISTQNQLERFNYELAIRKDTHPEENVEENPVTVCDDA